MNVNNTVNFVGGTNAGNERTKLQGGGRDWTLNDDATISARHHSHLVLGFRGPISYNTSAATSSPQQRVAIKASTRGAINSWEEHVKSGQTFCSFKTGTGPSQAVETFQFVRAGSGYATVGSSSGRNEYNASGRLLTHRQGHCTASLQPNGDFLWSHGYTSRRVDAPADGFAQAAPTSAPAPADSDDILQGKYRGLRKFDGRRKESIPGVGRQISNTDYTIYLWAKSTGPFDLMCSGRISSGVYLHIQLERGGIYFGHGWNDMNGSHFPRGTWASLAFIFSRS